MNGTILKNFLEYRKKKSTKIKVKTAGDEAKVSAQAVPKAKYNIRQN